MSQTVNCSFARDITAAMLVVGNKSVSLLWELNFNFMKILREKLYCINPQGDLHPISTSLQISRLKFSGQRSFVAVSCICHGQQMGKGQTKKVQRSYWNHSPAIAATTIAEIELFISQRLLSLRSLESDFMWSLWSQPSLKFFFSLNDHSDGSDYVETGL